MKNKKFWEVKNAANKSGEIYIYGSITSYKWDDTDITSTSFKKDLDSLGDIETLNLYINSGGGSVFQAQAIYSILKRHEAAKNVYIDGLAASAASFIAMAGDTIFIPKNATMMVHNPMGGVLGNAKAMRKAADMLDKVRVGMIEAYMAKIGDKITEDKLIELLDAETWLTAQECYDMGFCDELIEEKNIAACIDTEILAQYKNVPKDLWDMKGGDNQEERNAIIQEVQEHQNKIKEILGGI